MVLVLPHAGFSDVTEASMWQNKTHDDAETDSLCRVSRADGTDSDNVQINDSMMPIATLPEQVSQLFEEGRGRLNVNQSKDLFQLLDEYSDIFAKNSADFGKTTILKHNIDTGDEPPVKQRPRRFPR